MTPKTAFRIVHGLTMHFRTLEYSVLKYGHNTESARKAWEKLSAAQQNRYQHISDRFQDTQDLVYATIGCILDGVDLRYANTEVMMDSFYKMKRRREGLEYFIKSDNSTMEMVGDIGMMKILQRYFSGKLSPEYVIIKYFDELQEIYNNPKYAFCAEKVLHLIKYRDFINTGRYQSLVENEKESV